MATITSADVAKAAGVSRATVSQILNGRGQRFSAATRDRVQRAATELRYQPSMAGRTLGRGASDLVIALIPNTTFGGNLQDLFDILTSELARNGLTLVLRFSSSSADSFERAVIGMRPRTVLALGPLTERERDLLAEQNVQVVGPSPADRDDANREIGRLQAEHLASRGHRSIAFAHLRDARQDVFGSPREQGVRDRCRDLGLPEPPILRLGIDPTEAMQALATLRPRSAVACYNDDVAIALLSAARERGWDVPGEVALIGMDHTPMSRLTAPPLTTIAYDLHAAAQHLIDSVVSGADTPRSEPPSLTLIPGGTT